MGTQEFVIINLLKEQLKEQQKANEILAQHLRVITAILEKLDKK